MGSHRNNWWILYRWPYAFGVFVLCLMVHLFTLGSLLHDSQTHTREKCIVTLCELCLHHHFYCFVLFELRLMKRLDIIIVMCELWTLHIVFVHVNCFSKTLSRSVSHSYDRQSKMHFYFIRINDIQSFQHRWFSVLTRCMSALCICICVYTWPDKLALIVYAKSACDSISHSL